MPFADTPIYTDEAEFPALRAFGTELPQFTQTDVDAAYDEGFADGGGGGNGGTPPPVEGQLWPRGRF